MLFFCARVLHTSAIAYAAWVRHKLQTAMGVFCRRISLAHLSFVLAIVASALWCNRAMRSSVNGMGGKAAHKIKGMPLKPAPHKAIGYASQDQMQSKRQGRNPFFAAQKIR